jgi:hypothetical protein
MTLWFAVMSGVAAALTAGLSGIVAFILISLSQAAPILRSRIGRQPVMATFIEPRRMIAVNADNRHHIQLRWANMQS